MRNWHEMKGNSPLPNASVHGVPKRFMVSMDRARCQHMWHAVWQVCVSTADATIHKPRAPSTNHTRCLQACSQCQQRITIALFAITMASMQLFHIKLGSSFLRCLGLKAARHSDRHARRQASLAALPMPFAQAEGMAVALLAQHYR